MLRRELILRMTEGESLTGKSFDDKFVLGRGQSDRDLLPSWMIKRLIDDGLAEAIEQNAQIQIVLTSQTARWYEKRGIRPRQEHRVTV